MIALAPKNYVIITDHTHEMDIFDNKEQEVKLKGVSTRGNQNKQINKEAFEKCFHEGKMIGAENYILRTKNQQMSKQILRKNGISGVCTKSVVLENGACLPFIHGLKSSSYSFK
jgi:hypothetical protein